MKWWQTDSILESEARKISTRARTTYDYLLKQKAEREKAERERMAGAVATKERKLGEWRESGAKWFPATPLALAGIRQEEERRREGGRQLEEFGIEPTSLNIRNQLEAMYGEQPEGRYNWAERVTAEARAEEFEARTKEAEEEAKDREKIVSDLVKAEIVTSQTPSEDAESYIDWMSNVNVAIGNLPDVQQEIAKQHLKEVMKIGDYEVVKSEMELLLGQFTTAPQAEGITPPAEGVTPPEVEGQPWYKKIPGAIEAADLPFMLVAKYNDIASRDPGTLTDTQKEFISLYEAESKLKTPVAEVEQRYQDNPRAAEIMHHLTRIGGMAGLQLPFITYKPSEQLKESYYGITGLGEQIGESFRTPLGVALALIPGAAASRAGLLGKAAVQTAKGTKAGRVAAVGLKAGRAVLLPVELAEKAFALPFKGIAKGVAKVQQKRLMAKWGKIGAELEQDLAPLLKRVAEGGTLTTEEIAKVTAWDANYGKALKAIATKTEAKVAPELRAVGAAKPAAEVTSVTPEVTKPILEEAGIKARTVQITATKPDGGEAWELYNRLFAVEDAESAIKRLYPKDLESKLAEVVGKLPAGKGIIKTVNPSLTPRQTIQAQKVQELVIVAKDITTRRSQGIKGIVDDLIRSVIPDGDAVKLYKIDEKGIQHAFKPKAGFEKAPNGIIDVLEHPQKWELNETALKISAVWNNVRESAVKALERRGIKVNKAFYEEGAGYFPRMVTGGHGEQLGFPRVRFEKPRHYATQLEAIDNSIAYTQDPIENIMSFIDHFHQLVAYDDLTKAVKVVGRTPKDAIPLSRIITRAETAKEVRGLTHAQNALRRMKRGESLPEVTLKTIERNTKAFGKRARDAMALTGDERVTAVNKLLGELKTDIPKAQLNSLKARSGYKKALDMARSPILGEFERGTKHPAFRGRIFPEEVAKVLDDFTETGVGGFMKATRSVAETLRTLVAALDFSPMFIQGTPMLGRFPGKWAMTTLRSFRAMASPSYAHKWMAKPENVAIRTRIPELVGGDVHEYYAGLRGIKTAPIIGKLLGKIYEPFERFFTFWGKAARVEIAKALEPAFIRAGKVNQLGTYVNRMTGVMETRGLGVSATQRAAETSWVFFAPRYTRSCMAYIGNVFKGGIVGNEARRSLGQLAAGGMIAYLGICEATGQKPSIDPRYPTFMTLKVGNRHIGIGGFYYSFLRFITDVVTSVGEVGGEELVDFAKISRKDNPFIKFLYNRTSPLTGLVTEAFQQKDYLGYPFESPEDWAHWLFIEHMMPIALQEQFPERYTEEPTERGALLTAEMGGLRTFPVEPFYELADKYAQQLFKKNWNELWQPTKGGTYRMSAKQNLLLKRFPDLDEAYKSYHEKQSDRWKAEHGLMPDKDIALDAYAQERFKKNFDELTKIQKKRVQSAYEKART